MKSSFLENLKKLAKNQNWKFEKTKNNHYKFYSPDGKYIIVVSGTPSDFRAQKKAYADFKRAGMIFN